MVGVVDGIQETVGRFLGVLLVVGMYHLGKILLKEYKSKLKTFLVLLGISAFLAFMAWSILGTHVEDADPLFGGGDRIVDYEPTLAQKNRHGTVIFLMSFGSACAGLWSSAKDYPRRV